MGTFSIDVTVGNLSDPARNRRVSVMVDTGATYTTLPREVVEDLGCQPIGSRQVVRADGREDEWPIATVRLTVGEQEGPTFCLMGPAGGPALLGAVTLEEFALGVDPVAKRLVRVRSYLGKLSPALQHPTGMAAPPLNMTAASPGRARRRRRAPGCC